MHEAAEPQVAENEERERIIRPNYRESGGKDKRFYSHVHGRHGLTKKDASALSDRAQIKTSQRLDLVKTAKGPAIQ